MDVIHICRQCRKEIKTQIIKCLTCDKEFHPGCHKIHKVYNAELVTCYGKYEIFTVKGNSTGEESSATYKSSVGDNQVQVQDSNMESKIDWLVMKVRDEMINKNEIKNIITSIVRDELEGFKKELEDMKKMWNIMSTGNVSRNYSEVVKEKKKENVIIIKPKEQ